MSAELSMSAHQALRDADSALGSFALVLGDYQGQRTDSFYFSDLGDYNNKWDQIWNSGSRNPRPTR